MKVLLATTNLAKLKYYGSKLIEQGIEVLTINALNCKIDVNENGKNPLENAMIKAKAYCELTGFPTIAIDDGLYLEGVPDDIQPGTHVRRVNNKTLNDEEILELEKINQDGIREFIVDTILREKETHDIRIK